MIFIEKTIINADDTKTIYIAAVDIQKDTDVTNDNAGSLFKAEKRAVTSLPKGAITDLNELIGLITDRNIQAGEIMTVNSFSSVDARTTGIKNPIEVSFNAANISQVVGGVLREGDYVNIWSVKTVRDNGIIESKAEEICKFAYVTRAFTSTGTEVGRGTDNSDDATVVINIIISADDEAEFNKAIVDGTIRVSRVMYDVSEEE